MAGKLDGRLDGKVALVSGAARGQGRSIAVRLAQEGAAVVAFDVCQQLASVPYPMATPEDLKETTRLVEEVGGQILAREADAREGDALRALVAEAVAEFGRIDIVCANAGIVSYAANTWSMPDETWQEMVDVNLTGVWRTVSAAIPAMIEAGNGGSIVITSSIAGLKGMRGVAHYSAAKHGVVGLARSLAVELAPHSIRVNTVHPTGVNTPMVVNDAFAAVMAQSDADFDLGNLLPVAMVEPEDVAAAVAWLVSADARYVTGIALPVDAGVLQK
ncbi:mycofactocin-coupled SDR family oxidoreductase [Pseudonocardia sp. TRM90224]|uniref:mycofactocin-coupled SDR family oxidoreductase n=1 Tax=Pseudonocardia sp. TRM90224 TaxID=2812678 RepID=UPI001E525DF2|nr:mycofactocin-coupled SDR family oxidoreductase [Pseudonocardia sp. TRM90224]